VNRPTSTLAALLLTIVAAVSVAAGHGHAAPPGGSVKVEPMETILHAVQSKGDRGTLFRPPKDIKPPPGPRVRDQRGSAANLARSCGHHPRPCKAVVRDPRQ
jgi:hypothetical protein